MAKRNNMFDYIVMQLKFKNGAQISIKDPVVNVKSTMGGCGNIEGKLCDSLWTGELHVYLKNNPEVNIQYCEELINVRLLSDNTDFPEHCIDIPQIPMTGFSYEGYYNNLKNIKKRFEEFSVSVEGDKNKAIND